MKRVLFFFLLITNFCSAHTYQNGLIIPNFSKVEEDEVCCVYLPKGGFTVYSSPGGQQTGKLMRMEENKNDDQAPYKLFFRHSTVKALKKVDLSNLEEVGYEVWAISYFERRDGYVRVIEKTNDFWLSEDEIKLKGFNLVEWQSFLNSKAGDVLGFYANELGLKLREAPNLNSKSLFTMKGDLFEINLLKLYKGTWAKVKVRKYKEHPCVSDLKQDEIIEFELDGWVKLVDDVGRPNVWYYSRGC
ncbi:hypothetical protein [Pontibacter harenae]|uniref:hypothetical protein n=1 Tax=Pontibacter harenae TaxID=2894083 RepID=UPI001E295B41|nr:hypothetical protein [Pontibacter harenae]MCC9166490.1 hypothetical protein [Pontibacter harenae]